MKPSLLIALALCAVGAPSVAHAKEGVRNGARAQVAQLTPGEEFVQILRATRTAPADEKAALEARLRHLAVRVTDTALDVLSTRKLPAQREGERDQTLSEPQTALLLSCFEELSRDAGWAAVDRWSGGRRDVATRAASLMLAGRFARSRDLPRLLQLAVEPRETEVDPRLESAWEDAVVLTMRRDPLALRDLAEARGDLPEVLIPAWLRSLGRSGDDRALDAIDRALERFPDHAVLALAQIRLLPPARSPEASNALARRLRASLDRIDPGRPELVQAMIQGLGQLEDGRSAALLVDFVTEREHGVVESSLWALKRIGRTDFGRNADAWASWWREESDWFVRRRAPLVDRVATGDPALVSDALREIATHPLWRHEIAEDLVAILGTGSPAVRAIVARVLGQLGSPRALRALVDLVGDDDETVAAAAHASLVRLSGRDLPRTRAGCLAALFPAEVAY